MRFFSFYSALVGLTFSSLVSAAPELSPSTVLAFGHFKKIEEVTIYGDIRENIVILAQREVSNSVADVFIIDDISEDIENNMLVLSVSLYDDLSDGLVAR